MIQPPSRTRIFHAWLILMALTIASLATGRTGALGLVGGAAVVGIAGLKARYVLMDYLNLRLAGGAWRGLLTGYLLVIGGTVFAAFAIGGMRG